MKQIRLMSWGLVFIIATIMAGYIATNQSTTTNNNQGSVITPIAGFNQATHFNLINHRGEEFDSANKIKEGEFALVFFGFTHCPVICPTELQKMAVALDIMSDDVQNKLYPLFITIDPERDTTELLNDYVPQFHPNIIGLTGDVTTVHNVLDSWKVFYKKVNDPALTEYTMDHSTYAYLVDHNMKILALFPQKTTEEQIAAEITRIADTKNN